MTQQTHDINTLKVCDLNLQFYETLFELKDDLNISNELNEMLEYVFEINLQQFRIINEKIINDVNVL